MTIVDTSVWIDLLDGTNTPETSWLTEHIHTVEIGVLDLILCEVLQGVSSDNIAEDLLARFRHYRIYNTNRTLAVRSAQNYRRLRKQGFTIRGTIDSLIATFCIDNGMWLLHRDRDFNPFEDRLRMRVVHP